MSRLRNPFVSALLGGLVVAVAGWIAIAAGWIEAEGDGAPALPQSQPALVKPGDERGGTGAKGLTVSDIYEKDGPGVVFIEAETVGERPSPFDLFPERQGGTATGSGFVVDDDGFILTNAHVVNRATSIRVAFGDDRTVEARKVGQDSSTDVALLKVKVSKKLLHPLELGDSKKMQVGDPVVAIGNPFGLDRTVTTGIVSALQRRIEAPNGFSISDVIQTDASINPGNSGGPLLDASGRVIGINSQIATTGGGSVGIGFAVPINSARKVADELRDTGEVRHAFLGITGAGLRKRFTDSLNLPTDKGVLVQRVVEGGPADKAGIRGGKTQVEVAGVELALGGDIIVAVDGRKVTDMDQVVDAVDRRKPGDRMKLTLLRGKKRQTVTARLGNRPQRVNRE